MSLLVIIIHGKTKLESRCFQHLGKERTMSFRATTETVNPIDLVEQIAIARQWTHKRNNSDNLTIIQAGKWITCLVVIKDDNDSVNFTCSYDFICRCPAKLRFYQLINLVNLCISPRGFAYDTENKKLLYATSIDFDDDRPITSEMMEERIKTMAVLCDNFYISFASLVAKPVFSKKLNNVVTRPLTVEQALTLAFTSPVGRA